MKNTCPCGARTTPDPLCDMCDAWQTHNNTGWGGFRDNYRQKNYNNEEERQLDRNNDDLNDRDFRDNDIEEW